MFGNVWKWAGMFRLSNKNFGVDKHSISTELRMLLDDCNYWLDHKTFGQDETAVRFKHRIVSIHCFANGNGRHSRLIGDMIVEKILGGEIFSWGGKSLIQKGDFRATYLNALRAADKGDYLPLIAFARS
jgi:Fic-DOC domain mobile mystery protein B